MFKKYISALLAGALILSYSALTTSCKDYDDDIDDLNARIDNLETVTIADIQSQITSIQSSITSIQSDLNSSVSSLTTQISSVGADVTALESSMNSQISNLKSTLTAYVDGEIADVESAISSLESSLANYYTKDEAQSTINTLLANYYTKTQIDEMFTSASATVSAEVTARQEAIAGLQSQIDELEKSIASLKAELNSASDDNIAALEAAIAENEAAVEALQAQVDENEADIATLNTALEDLAADFDEFLEELATWIGEEFSTYISNYITYDYLVKYVDGVTLALFEQILSEIQTKNSSYYNAILAIVKTVTDPLKAELDALEAEFDAYVLSINTLLKEYDEIITDLETRVQSFSYVPAYTDGKVYFNGYQYMSINGSEDVLCNTTSNGVTAEVKFLVTPASVATSIANQSGGWSYSIISNEVAVRADSYLSIESATVDSDGYLVFTIKSTYPFTDANETLMFAITVANSDAGASYTSEYIETAALGPVGDVTSYFSLGLTTDGVLAAVTGTTSKETTLTIPADATKYTTETVTLFDAYTYVFVYDGVVYSLEDAAKAFGWTTTPSVETSTGVYMVGASGSETDITNKSDVYDGVTFFSHSGDTLKIGVACYIVDVYFYGTRTYSLVMNGNTYLTDDNFTHKVLRTDPYNVTTTVKD